MARRNPLRSLQSEANLALRIASEREARGWTYEGLAKRLTDAGCPIQGSAIYKIEKGDPPRRITVDELVGLSRVFDVDVTDLLVPANVLQDRRARKLFGQWIDAAELVGVAARKRDALWVELQECIAQHPSSMEGVEAALRAHAQTVGWDVDEATDYWLLKIRGVEHDSAEWEEHVKRYGGVATDGEYPEAP